MADMHTLGISLIVGGAAFVCSGLVFLLPAERKVFASEKSVEESLQEIEGYLRQMVEIERP
jgi:hypothetical protein